MIPPYSVRRSWLPGIVSSVTARTTTLLACMAVAVFVATVQGQAKPPMASMVPEGPGWELTGNLLQLMRGIFFPTSNTIFNVQKHDPAEKKITMRPGSGTESFDWVQWGAGLYSGWEDVDYAAVALAEVTPLLLTRGRLCQNGKPRNQEAVSDSTNDLSDACQGCHRVYRDRRAPGVEPGNPASLALRCMAP
jgi:hypothetical protein